MKYPSDHKSALLLRQLNQARASDGSLSVDALLDLVDQTYQQHQQDMKRINRANRLMAEELDEMLALREQQDLERVKRLDELEQAYAALAVQESRATHLAFHDPLTGLANRSLLSERLAQARASILHSGLPVGVHCIDLDHFKVINDTFGHQVGDELIHVVSKRLSNLCGPHDTLARLGGDEFCLVQPGVLPGQASAMAERIIRTVMQPIQLSAGVVFVGCSVGLAIVEDAGVHALEALRRADLALYRAKDLGRGRYAVFADEMDAAVRFKRALQDDLRAALAAEQISLVFQPQMTSDGRLLGVETLARWRHAERGEVPAHQFVEAAEECGLIVELGAYVMRQAFAHGRRWPGLRISINVSPRQLHLRDFVSNVVHWLKEAGVAASQFELEITESCVLSDDPETLQRLQDLRALGFGLALDDFGTGYSSLSYLQLYPITKVKIDRSFTVRLEKDPGAAAVIRAIFDVAAALNLSVVAEGVETEAQLKALADTGPCMIQGYIFSPPALAAEIDALVFDRGGLSAVRQDMVERRSARA